MAGITALGRTSVTFWFELTREGELCAEGELVAVFVDDLGEPREWEPGHRRVLAPG
jgi:acyl-CoA thioesterase FadM